MQRRGRAGRAGCAANGVGLTRRTRAIGFFVGGLAALVLALLAALAFEPSPEPAAAQGPGQPCNTYDSAGVSYFEVPAGVTQIEASVYGAEGGFVLPASAQFGLPGQGGGVVAAVIPVTPGEVLEIRAGGHGVDSVGAQTPAPPGGFNGGGAGAVGIAHTSSTGGGASAILRGSSTLVIAGGGGGAAHGGGGGDGGLVGTDGTKNAGSLAGSTGGLAGGNGGTGGTGGTAIPAPQAGGNGSPGQGGRGGGDTTAPPTDGGGGGGGGFVGGGGGGAGAGNGGSGGGGGSSFDSTGTATFETGVETGDGRVTLSYNCVAAPQPQSCVTFDTPGTHSFQVPAWVHEVDAAVYGAQGGDVPNAVAAQSGTGGLGGGATGLPIPVTPGETLDVAVGGRGTDGGGAAPPAPAGGSGGGGAGGAETIRSGAGGGGASAIRRGVQTLVLVGGGGGGASSGDGGAGGFVGNEGTKKTAAAAFPGRSGGNGGTGGTGPSAGQNGSAGQGGAGGGDLSTTTATAGGGGGGGGAVGGGGGAASGSFGSAGGGGGSSAQSVGQVPVSWHTGVETGDGRVVLSYDCSGTDLSIEKLASAGTITAGGQVMYTLIVRNNGPAGDTGVTVTDSIPAGLDAVSAVPGQGSCQIAAAVTCSLGDLAAGGSTQILVTANVGNDVRGDVTNGAEVSGDRDDTDPTNNRDERTINVDPPPPPPPPAVDLEVKKSVSATRADPGDQLTYTLVVTNDGPGDASSVKLVDTPPAEIRYVSARTGQGKCDVDAGVLRCSLGDLPADGQTQVQVTGEVRSGAIGTLRNVATVTAAEEDKNPDDNLDRQDVTVPRPGGPQPRLDLRITKKASKVSSSGRVTYTLVVRNNGPDTAHEAVVVDTASRRMKVLSAKASKGKCKVVPPIRCRLGTIGKGMKVDIKVVAKLTEAGKLTNAASVASADEDAQPKNNLARAQSRLRPRMQLVKRAMTSPVPKGREAAFRISVKNRSSAAIRSVTVCDPLPNGLSFKRSAPRASRNGDRVCWRIRKLGAGQTRSFEVVATMRKSNGMVTNRATATAPGVGAARGAAGVNAGQGGCPGIASRTMRRC
jgi:uncharacterized repeat protein (TIGR01451 family)